MKSDIEIKDDIYLFMKDSALVKEVSGTLSKRKRPKDSKKEDIIISILDNQNRQKQEAFVNVNIYVQDQDEEGQMQEDSPRLRKLCKMAEELLDVGRKGSFRFNLDKQRVFEVPDTNEHVINNRLLYKQINE